MITRIVRMNFKEGNVQEFQGIFGKYAEKIRSTEGCVHLELWQDISDSRTFFTYSIWEGEEYLEEYRQSDLFRHVWGRTRELFDNKPQAWSVSRLVHLP